MRFSFYTIDTSYCNFLRQFDAKVPHTMEKKSSRPFVGIVFSIRDFKYYAPLTSPKPKHLAMSNQIDFLKINNGIWGAVNFNNMIPVNDFSIKEIDMRIDKYDSQDVITYKKLLMNQLSWCNSHRDLILKQAEKLYCMIVNNKAWKSLADRCCNFSEDEKRCKEYTYKRQIVDLGDR